MERAETCHPLGQSRIGEVQDVVGDIHAQRMALAGCVHENVGNEMRGSTTLDFERASCDPGTLRRLLAGPEPVLSLAPMQDVTDLPFWTLMARYGGADLYFTEYFRVYQHSCLDKNVLRSVTKNPTGRPAIAQMIGNDISSLVRTAKELQHYPIVAVDLNLGCPAPVVYRKRAGGGLLRELDRVDSILGALRDAITKTAFTVKTRIGFDDPGVFEDLLPIFARHSLDLLTIHGRTVKEQYRSEVHYDFIARAVDALNCPVMANGNVYSPENAEAILEVTGACGLMIGRGVIRNPWLFDQIRQHRAGRPVFQPRGRDLMKYVRELYRITFPPGVAEALQVQKMKKYMNFIGVGVDADGRFLHEIRRASTEREFFRICKAHLDHDHPICPAPFVVTGNASH
jgi:tRNA-dihydrouridine synthase B